MAEKLVVSGARGASVAELARITGTFLGSDITSDMTDTDVLNAPLEGINERVTAATSVRPVAPVRVATTASITRSGLPIIDGVQIAEGDRVLDKDATAAASRGVYVATASGFWTRATDFDSAGDAAQGSYIVVLEGDQAGAWILATPDPITIGTTAQMWQPFRFSSLEKTVFKQFGSGALGVSGRDKLRQMPINVALDFGVKAGPLNADGRAANRAAFNRAIAAANTLGKMLFLPVGTFELDGPLDYIRGPGLTGENARDAIIHLYTTASGIITKGAYTQLHNFTVINKMTGTGGTNDACVRIKNCVYGKFHNVLTFHDLDNYTGIMLEHEYDGSAYDAAFLAHIGCWYNHFSGCVANYVAIGDSHGFGIRFRVDDSAIGVVNPPNQAPGTYTGQCSYNILDMPNIEQRSQGLRIEKGICNQVRGGQFLGSTVQVRLIDSSNNQFVGTRHNQWLGKIAQETGASGMNVFLYPVLFNVGSPSDWGLGFDLFQTSTVIRGDTKGSWIPTLFFGPTQQSLARSSGSFTKVGNLVTVNWDIRLASAPTATQVMSIGNLPFTALNDSTQGLATARVDIVDHGSMPASPSGNFGFGYCSSKTITAIVDNTQALTGAHFGAGAIILGSMTYFTTEW